MKIASGVKKVVKPFVDVPTWLGYRQLADSTKSIWDVLKNLFVPQKAGPQEDFSAAMARFNLSETDVQQRANAFTRLALIFLFIACGVFAYAIYMIWEGSIRGTLASLAITLIAIAFAFRYHFWSFQIKQRKLGCTLRDWLDSGFAGSNK